MGVLGGLYGEPTFGVNMVRLALYRLKVRTDS